MNKLVIILVALFISGCQTNQNIENNQKPDNVTDCTMEAKECPDGSYVGRVGPDCEFSPCSEIEEEAVEEQSVFEPIDDFESRITKKVFGQYITKANSPVQPERFSGYHTGVDVEYDDVDDEVEVRAITDGEVVLSRKATGYGGVMVIRHTINNTEYFVVYGHLDPSSMLAVGTKVSGNQSIAFLGDDKSIETDGERKHLHFAIYKGKVENILGYVQSESQLAQWEDPLEFLKQF